MKDFEEGLQVMASQGLASQGKSRSWHVDDYGTEIIDIGECRSGGQEVAQPLEEPRGVVFGKKGGGIEAELCGAGQGGRVDEGPCRVVGAAGAAIGAVGVPRDRGYAWGAFERAGDRDKARIYYEKLLAVAVAADSERPELREAKAFR